MMNGIDARSSLGDDILLRRVHFEDLVHAEHVEENAALERRADTHSHAAFGDNRDFMLVGECEYSAQHVIAGVVGFHPDYNVEKRAVSAISQRVLVIDF